MPNESFKNPEAQPQYTPKQKRDLLEAILNALVTNKDSEKSEA